MSDAILYNNDSVNIIIPLITVSVYCTVILARHSARPFIFIILFNSQTNTIRQLFWGHFIDEKTKVQRSKFSEKIQPVREGA